MSAAWINGQPASSISLEDRGLQYGDGLFETITCIDGRPRWLQRHLARLRRGCERLRLRFDAWETLGKEICLVASGEQACILKLILTRGTAQRRGYRPTGLETPTRILTRHPWPAPPANATAGFRVVISPVRLGCNSLLAGLKHLNRLEQVLAQLALEDTSMDEVLMMASTGELIGGSMSNLFIADAHGLSTPSLELCGVGGIMRERICSAGAKAGVPVRIRSIDPDELDSVEEAFLTNVRWGVQSIGWLEGRHLTRRDWATRVQEWLDASPD